MFIGRRTRSFRKKYGLSFSGEANVANKAKSSIEFHGVKGILYTPNCFAHSLDMAMSTRRLILIKNIHTFVVKYTYILYILSHKYNIPFVLYFSKYKVKN